MWSLSPKWDDPGDITMTSSGLLYQPSMLLTVSPEEVKGQSDGADVCVTSLHVWHTIKAEINCWCVQQNMEQTSVSWLKMAAGPGGRTHTGESRKLNLVMETRATRREHQTQQHRSEKKSMRLEKGEGGDNHMTWQHWLPNTDHTHVHVHV